jgi:hypothetical protein
VSSAHAADLGQPSDGGGGSPGTSPTTPPGTTECFMSFGGGSGYSVSFGDTLGSPFLGISMHFTLPGGTFTARQRFVSQGADGETTSDSGWQDNMVGSTGDPVLYPGPGDFNTGQYIYDPGNSIDISGGTQYTIEATNDQTGETFDAWGETYPPDPIAGNC